MVELYGGLELNFLPIDMEKFHVTPYVFAGIGAFYGRPFTEDAAGNKIILRDMSTEGQGLGQYPDRKVYPLVNAMFPFGGGIKCFIGNTVMLSAEVGLRYAATDYSRRCEPLLCKYGYPAGLQRSKSRRRILQR